MSYIKSLGVTLWECLKRSPRWALEIGKMLILCIVTAVVLTGVLLEISSLIGNGVGTLIGFLVVLIIVVVGVISSLIAADFRRWVKRAGMSCTRETLDKYFAFKKEHDLWYGESIFIYDFDTCKQIISYRVQRTMEKKGTTFPTS